MTSRLSPDDLAAALPDVSTPQRFDGLQAGAVIRRDRHGIPHIKSDNEHDLFFAQGFATAQDRLFQMDYDRLRCLGRIAEYLGERARAQDTLMRRRGMERIARLDYELAGPEAKRAMDAYSAGVNAFLDSTTALPVEYKLLQTRPEAWEPWHCALVYKVRNSAEGSFQGKLWLSRLAAAIGAPAAARLSPGYQPGSLLTVPPGTRYTGPVLNAIDELQAVVQASSFLNETESGSNGWSISGERTASGKPLVGGDSHRALEVPNVYYQVHLHGPDFRISGFAIPGVPMAMHFCHNEHVCFGMTHGGVDTQDLFVERFRTENGTLEYLFEDAWYPAEVRSEQIRVRGESATHSIEVVHTRHGPVIAGDPRSGAAISLRDPGSIDATPWIDAAYRAMKARSADEFEAALAGWTDRVNNYPYADVHGEFGYALRGRIPIRDSGNGWGPVAGWSADNEWRGFIDPAQLPRSRNPSTGWAVTCNQRVVDQDYPYYLTNFFGPGYRAERIAHGIEQLTGHPARAEDMERLYADAVSIPAQAFKQAVARCESLHGKAARAAALLADWDCAMRVDSNAAALYSVAMGRLTADIVSAACGEFASGLLEGTQPGAEEHWRRHLKAALTAALHSGDTALLPDGRHWPDLLQNALEAAWSLLETRLGEDPSSWRWGALHKVVIRHPLAALFPENADLLNPPVVEIGGDGDTPLASGAKVGADFVVSLSSVNRYVHDPADWRNSRWISPLGASGHPGSPHYCDQQRLWSRVESILQLWDWADIGEQARTEQHLQRP
ncbi:MAG: penicillin acylase family protein [Gammaproteobacteria bacterium]|nr:penicillin acylase family protein [Gammaproteobacteria bacterium]